MFKFNIGDRVKVVDTVAVDEWFLGKIGTIVDTYIIEIYLEDEGELKAQLNKQYEIEFDDTIEGMKYGWTTGYDIIRLVKND